MKEIKEEYRQPNQLELDGVNVDEMVLELTRDLANAILINSSMCQEEIEKKLNFQFERIGHHSKHYSTLSLYGDEMIMDS